MQIDVVPFGGLGNRMRVMNAAFELNKLLKGKLGLFWLVKAELNAPLNALFKDTGHTYQLISGLRYRLFLLLVKHIYTQKHPLLYKITLRLFYDLVLFDEELYHKTEQEILSLVANKKRILIATCYDFLPVKSFDNFTLSDKLQLRLSELSLPADTIGVHVRRTDHAEIIRDSSLEKYDAHVSKEIKMNPKATFYLATDDYLVKKHFKQLLGKNLITQDFELSRASSGGVENAVIDIYSLAKCTKLICNSKSSFAVTAQLIGKKKIIVEV